jgi:hypothetical protein
MVVDLANLAVCLGILWTIFCRLVIVRETTHPAIRYSIVAPRSVAATSAMSPWA